MNTYSDKSHNNTSRSVADSVAQKQSGGESVFQFVDNRPVAIQMQRLQVIASNSPQVRRTAQFQVIANHQGVVQATIVGGIDVTFTRGYASWDQDGKSWHINWSLGEENVYHVTDESTKPKTHYFFKLSAGEISDAVAPKGMKGKKKSSKKFSALPDVVQTYIRLNINSLQTE